MSSFQVFNSRSDVDDCRQDASIFARAAKSQGTLQKTLQNQTLSPRTPLQQLPQNCLPADPPPRKRHCLRDVRLELALLNSSPFCAPESTPLDRYSTSLQQLIIDAPLPLANPLLIPLKSQANLPVPKKRGRLRKDASAPSLQQPLVNAPLPSAAPSTKKPRGRPPKGKANPPVPKKMGDLRKNDATALSEQISEAPRGEGLLNRKTVQEMEATKHSKATETTQEKRHRVYADKSRRHAREYARALRKGDPVPVPLSSLVPSPSPSQTRYRICEQCHIPKAIAQFLPAGCNDEYDNYCLHCLTDSTGDSDETRWCYGGSHEVPRSVCIFNNEEYSRCNQCAKRIPDVPPPPPENTLDDKAVPAEHWRLIEKFNSELDKLERVACDVCNEIDFDMGIKKHHDLNECKRCRAERGRSASNYIAKFGKGNEMDPGAVPSHLPPLSIAEEMLIARAHVHMDFRRVKGCQYKYSGHVVNFMQNTAKIVNRLPSLPTELQVIILKPSSSSVKDSAVHREFAKTFRVQRKNVEMWLKFLVIHHPDYKNLVIDRERLSQLPDDDTVIGAFNTVLHDDEEDVDKNESNNDAAMPREAMDEKEHTSIREVNPLANEATTNNDAAMLGEAMDENENTPIQEVNPLDPPPDAPEIDTCCVPDITDERTELAHLQGQINDQKQEAVSMSMASMESVPLDERSKSLHIARMAFPTLFPTGAASFNSPREISLDLRGYHLHLMRYRDGRFARHPQFRYWASNTQMRQQAFATSKWCTNRTADKMVDIETLREMASKDDSHLPKMLARKAVNLRGTRPFWQNKSRELEALVRDRNADFFATASPADMQWSDLYRHMPDRELAKGATEEERRRLNFRLLQENPHIAATYLCRRWNLFFGHVLKKVFDIDDHWFRYEWQARGSGHIHGLYWTKDSPKVNELEDYLSYWGQLVSAVNPDGDLPPAPVHPCSRPFSTRHNNRQKLAEVINRCQRHTKCSQAYCLRKQKETKQTVCRFNFPRTLRPTPDVNNEANPRWLKFAPVRNDPLLNNYNPTFTMGWLANVDVSPCTDQKAVLYYVAKYCAKAETKTAKLDELMKGILPHISSKNPMGSLVTKFMNKLLGERDISAQETCHLLLGLDLTSSSRLVDSMNVRPREQLNRALPFIDKGNPLPADTYLEKYCDRPEEMEERTLYQMHTLYNWSPKLGFTLRTRGKPIVLNLYPLYSSDPEHRDYEQFCRVKMMLHHPFRSVELDDLFTLENGSPADNWQSVYEECLARHHNHPPDPLGVHRQEVDDESDTESLEQGGADDVKHEELLSMRRPHHDGSQVEVESDLGRRPEDKGYHWLAPKGCPVYVDQWSEHVALARGVDSPQNAPETLAQAGDVSILNAGQRQGFDRVVDHYLDSPNTQLLLHLDGVAGTGKSKLIDMISSHLAYHAGQRGLPNPVFRAAPTGVAAYNIHGSTLHQRLSLPVNRPWYELSGEKLADMQAEFRKCKLLIIDEKSMIGFKMLHQVDMRLRSIMACPNVFFGGMNVLLCGDFGQLPPVGDSALYTLPTASKASVAVIAGKAAYDAFAETVVLTEIMRQQGDSPSACQFREVLNQLRDGPLSRENWQFLLSRTSENLDTKVRTKFNSALHLYPTRKQTTAYNLQRLEQLGKPVLSINAINCGKGAKDGTVDDTGLENELLLSKGSRVMITRNLWTSGGLVNGTMGTVYDMVWEDGVEDPFATMPAVVLVAVDDYAGPASIVFNGVHVVPVVPADAQWEVKHEVCQRKQFPLMLAFGIIIHKSQGLTLARVVLNFDSKDFTSGLSYVALSRVRAIEHVMFETGFSRDRFPAEPTPVVKRRIAEGRDRINKLARSSDKSASSTRIAPPPSSPPPPVLPVPSGPPADPARFNGLRGKTISEALRLGTVKIEQMHELLPLARRELTHLFRKIRQKDEVALAIGAFPVLHCQPDGEYCPFARGFRLGMALFVDVFCLYSLLDRGWLSAGAIDGVLAELAVLSPGVQLMSSEKAYYHYCKLNQNQTVPSNNVINLRPDTHTLVFPFNLSGDHWCVAKASCHEGRRLLTVYNSLSGLGAGLIETWLPTVLDCIIDANSVAHWTDSRWDSEKVVQGRSLGQVDNHSCGVYAIFNALALVRQREPSLDPVNTKLLRAEYARALVKAI